MLIDYRKLKEYRKKAGITQKEMAKKIGVSEITCQFYEMGKRNPKEKTAARMELVLGVKLATTKKEEVYSLAKDITVNMRKAKELLGLSEIGEMKLNDIMLLLENEWKTCN